jgi:hypothetical protein
MPHSASDRKSFPSPAAEKILRVTVSYCGDVYVVHTEADLIALVLLLEQLERLAA